MTMKFPACPYKLTRITWLDACNHGDADSSSEGVLRHTVGYMLRDKGLVVRLTTTVDYDEENKVWHPSRQNDIVDIPIGMVKARREFK